LAGRALRAGWTCDSSRRICGANLATASYHAHRAEHDLGYLLRVYPLYLSDPAHR
jgi:hypothetical protein